MADQTSGGEATALTEEERESLAELALLYGTFMVGRWAEVMASDEEPADDWQEAAAVEAVELFAPGAADLLTSARLAADRAAPDEAAIKAVLALIASEVERGYYPDGTVRVRDVTDYLRQPGLAHRAAAIVADAHDRDGGGQG